MCALARVCVIGLGLCKRLYSDAPAADLLCYGDMAGGRGLRMHQCATYA